MSDTTPAPAADAARRLLKQRAAALAAPVERAGAERSSTVLALVLGAERYGVDARHVEEVARLPPLALLPGAPVPWLGLVNVRGTVRPVISLRRYLGLAPDPPGQTGALVLLHARGLSVAALVDAIGGVHRVPDGEVSPAVGGPRAHPVIRGVTPSLLTLLDAEALLDDPAFLGGAPEADA